MNGELRVRSDLGICQGADVSIVASRKNEPAFSLITDEMVMVAPSKEPRTIVRVRLYPAEEILQARLNFRARVP